MHTKRLIGIHGGTFDPIHFGHLRSALEVLTALQLDEVRFIPVYQPVHRDSPSATAQQPCDMVRLAIQSQPKFQLDTLEIDRGGPSYTVDTLRRLKSRMPDANLVLIMGTDAFAKFDSWHDWPGILKLANIVVTHRPGEPLPTKGGVNAILQTHWVDHLTQGQGQIVDLPITQLDLSATALREALQKGQPVDYLMPQSVVDYIQQHQLYQ